MSPLYNRAKSKQSRWGFPLNVSTAPFHLNRKHPRSSGPSRTSQRGFDVTGERRSRANFGVFLYQPAISGQLPHVTQDLLNDLLSGTNAYWNAWILRSTYTGSWKEAVHRSALALKLLIFEPTGQCSLTSVLPLRVTIV